MLGSGELGVSSVRACRQIVNSPPPATYCLMDIIKPVQFILTDNMFAALMTLAGVYWSQWHCCFGHVPVLTADVLRGKEQVRNSWSMDLSIVAYEFEILLFHKRAVDNDGGTNGNDLQRVCKYAACGNESADVQTIQVMRIDCKHRFGLAKKKK